MSVKLVSRWFCVSWPTRTGHPIYNVAKLRAACINGPEKVPWCIPRPTGGWNAANLGNFDPAARKSLAAQLGPGKKFSVTWRMVIGSSWIVNRPSTNRPWWATVSKVWRGKDAPHALRQLWRLQCRFWRWRNEHALPQNELARSELSSIANTDAQYLVPTDGSPLRGLIQDHVVTGVILTLKDTFLDSETFQQVRVDCRCYNDY